jgi:hypothetical protein
MGPNTRSQGGGSRDDLDQLHGNSCLSGFIVLKVKLLINFFGVLRRVLHCVHSCGLLGGGVLKESNPEVGSQIQFVKSWVRGVLIRESLVVELGELHGLEESFSWHQVQVSWHVGDSGHELVVDNGDLISILGHGGDVNSHSHNSWVVVRSSNLGDRGLQEVWEWSHHCGGSFISNREDLHL